MILVTFFSLKNTIIRCVFILAIFYNKIFCISDEINMYIYAQFSIFHKAQNWKISNSISKTPRGHITSDKKIKFF